MAIATPDMGCGAFAMTAEQLLEELSDPACYPDPPPAVQVLQTHLSVVCIAGERVYKLKKAKTLPFVDFSSLAARRTFCREEVRLNRRLCPDVYLGTCALRRTAAGLRFTAVGDDEQQGDVDVAVVMKRLPADRMLDELVRHDAVPVAAIEALARQIAAFHASAARSPQVLQAGNPDQLAGFAKANFEELAAMPEHGVPPDLLTALASASAAEFARQLPILRTRAERGLVVDGHGDLHARNICMTEPATVYDCIEFAPAFRCGDVATENAFLVMDLRYRGAATLAAAYEDAYVRASGDHEQRDLLPLLCSYRAMVRAKVAALAAAEPELPAEDRQNARESTLRHVLLAAAMLVETRGPLWVVVFGPPASGKSTLCAQLAKIGAWPHLATDAIRKELAGLAPHARASAEHYTAAFSDRTYGELAKRAASQTVAGQRTVLLDGNFATPARRAQLAQQAAAKGCAVVFVHLAVDAATAEVRAGRRRAEGSSTSDAGPAEAAVLHRDFQPPTKDEKLALVHLDGAQDTPSLMTGALRDLLLLRNERSGLG
ncbi:MAG: AAA family ATPase [Planctomycetes bacterium]|nr:AAA family ATPase [Planctomycetota bacterium]